MGQITVGRYRILLEQVVKNGYVICKRPSLDIIRQKAAQNLSHLPDKYKKLNEAPVYPVEYTRKLVALREKVVEKIKREEINKAL